MKKTLSLFFISLLCSMPTLVNGQELTIDYVVKVNVNSPTVFQDAGVTEDIRQMLVNAYRDIEMAYRISHNNGETELRMIPMDKKQELVIMGQKIDLDMAMKEQLKNVTYRNYSENLSLDKVGFFGKIFLIQDTIPIVEFVDAEEPTREILGYECKKAVSKDGTQSIWYAPLIPINEGPIVANLKGLILEGELDQYIYKASSIKEGVDHEIERPTGAKPMSRKDFDAMVKKRIDAMKMGMNQ